MQYTTYSVGAIAVAPGETSVSGAGTSWVAAGLRTGDIFMAGGLSVSVASIDGPEALTLSLPWPGGALSGADYEVQYISDATRVLTATREAIALFGDVSGVKEPPYTPFASRLSAQAASIPATIQYLNIDGLDYKRDPSGTALTTADGSTWAPLGTVTPLHFGAVGDAVTDDTAALNAMFAYARVTLVSSALIRPVVIDGRGRTFCTFGSVDATRLQGNKGLSIRDLYITSRAGGKVALDMSGSRWFEMENVHVFGQGQSDVMRRPWSGILFARADDVSPSANFVLRNVSTDGYFRGAGMHNYASEIVTAEACYFINRAETTGSSSPAAPDYAPAYGGVFDGRGTVPHKSEFVAGVTGRQSFTVNTYVGCTIQKPFGITGPAMYISDMNSTTFIKPYITNGGGGAVINWRVWNDFTPYSVEFDGLQVETDGNPSVFNFQTGGVASAFQINGLSVSFGNIFSAEDVIRTDSVAGALIRLRDFSLKIRRWQGVTPTNGVFSPRARFAVGGEIVVPAATSLGTITDYADFTAIVTDLTLNQRQTWGRSFLRNGATIYTDLTFSGLPIYADNAAAIAGGMANGRVYRTATGELRIVV